MSKKGSLEERTVVKLFEALGYGAIRVPASGARTNSDKPDVVAGNGVNYYAVEVKSSKKDYIYIRSEQVDELLRFSERFGAVPLIVAKFTRLDYIVFRINDMKRTKSGKYSIQRDEAREGITLIDFVKEHEVDYDSRT